MLVEEDPDQPAPHHRLDPERDAAADEVADEERDAEGQRHPEQVQPVDPDEEAVVVEVAAVLAPLLHAEVREQPADVRVDEALRRAPRAVAVADVRRVRVARLVRERVVLAMVGDPLDERALHRHAAEDRERRLHRRARLEALVREVAVEADRRPERTDDVEGGEHGDVDQVEGDSPERSRGDGDSERRDDDGDERHRLADPARARTHGSDVRAHAAAQVSIRSAGEGGPASGARQRHDAAARAHGDPVHGAGDDA